MTDDEEKRPTRRRCLKCKKNRWFRYNPETGHSHCEVCGDWRSKVRRPGKRGKVLEWREERK